jgi:hypothetical protein
MTTKTNDTKPSNDKPNTNVWSPVRIMIELAFTSDSRRVTPRDLERATEAANAAFRASLESRSPAYKIASITATLEYVYVQVQRKIKG